MKLVNYKAELSTSFNDNLYTTVYKVILLGMLAFLLSSCASMPQPDERMVASGHINDPVPVVATKQLNIPPVVTRVPALAPPKPTEKLQTFTVVVADVPANELLFALARDARLNLDIDPKVNGRVSINAIDQTLPQILNRIARQIDLRYYMDGPNLVVEVDKPFVRVYGIDYLNMERKSISSTSLSSKIASTGVEGSQSGNDSSSSIKNTSNNSFWTTLEKNIGSMVESGNVISNRETGYISVMATSKEHKNIQNFLDKVMNSARRQVLIEATVVEITLNDDFQAGVDWSRIASGKGWSFAQGLAPLANPLSLLTANSAVAATYNSVGADSTVSASIKALSEFGDVKVMSSPKIMALNNQTSILKVVDNTVYFETKSNTVISSTTGVSNTTFTTTAKTVPVGFVMNVTPYISATDEVILNVRPTISRIVRFVNDPNPNLLIPSQIPEIQVREMESVLRVSSGDTAVIGGLMQDSVSKTRSGLPGLSSEEGFGFLFGQNQRNLDKTELVIFLRPRVIRSANIKGELQDFQRFLKPSTSKQ